MKFSKLTDSIGKFISGLFNGLPLSLTYSV
nr:MAG TPA: hypothetical protein [Caudoviricetes sp.]